LAFQRECANLHNTHMKGTMGVEGQGYFYGSLDVAFQLSVLTCASVPVWIWNWVKLAHSMLSRFVWICASP